MTNSVSNLNCRDEARTARLPINLVALIVTLTAILILASNAVAQTTSFTYQGKLADGGSPANGQYDFTMTLWDATAAGTQIGSPVNLQNVTVVDGIFTVKLDFGLAAFNGASRFLEISVKASGNASTPTLLTPRQQVVSTPYAIKSFGSASADGLSSACNKCINASQINSVNGSSVDGPISVLSIPAGSGYYIQNGTTPQLFANFNISGNGAVGGDMNVGATVKANTVNASGSYQLNTVTILTASAPLGNLFVGVSAGGLTNGGSNTFVGGYAGSANTTGSQNSFFGYLAGESSTGEDNSFFGAFSGGENITGSRNSFFGKDSGQKNQSGSDNTFFGYKAGVLNNGSQNSYFGGTAGSGTGSGSNNAFFGYGAGYSITTGSGNTLIGASSGLAVSTGTNNTLLGANSNVNGNPDHGTAIGAGAVVTSSNTLVLGRSNGSDKVVVYGLGTAGSTALCRNASNQIATCSSSLRYKTNVRTFASGLNVVNRLRPITFTWKDGGMPDVGFAAEEVASVEPLLTFQNSKGEIEGVKYNQITVVLVNAIKEQQAQITAQQTRIESLQAIQFENQKLQAQLSRMSSRLARLEKKTRRRK